MPFDLKIVNGTVLDGTGQPPKQTNVAISGGKIVEIGPCDGLATRTIDANGAIVTPGFIDLHCHYDGQVSWDAEISPSSSHGVTTAVMGNCGVGFAPVRIKDREKIIELMEGVEDIPGSALAEGIRWRWESFTEYMDAIDDFPHAIDFVAQVPHDVLRVYVMGERAIAGQSANEDDIATMQKHMKEALAAGAAGFSTGRSDNHRNKDGSPTPASEASIAELTGLAKSLLGFEHGVLQAVSDFDMEHSPERFDPEFDVIEKMAEAAPGHATSISLNQRDYAPDLWKRILQRVENANGRGVPMRVQVAPRGIGVMIGLQATFHPFMGYPSYKKIAHLPLEERVKVLSQPEIKKQILSEKSDKVAGDGSALPPLADKFLAAIDFVSMRLFRLGENPNYEPSMDDSICAEAYRRGVTPLEAIYDTLLLNDGKELLYFPVYNYTEFSLDNVHTMLTHPLALFGLSDGGAHVGTVCDASFPTYMLTHWVRDRAKDRISLERAIQMLSSDAARYIGLKDRGEIRVGAKADINVIDLNNLAIFRPRMVKDLPGGGQRLLQEAKGYRATLVGGDVILENDQLTGKRPGRLVRVGR